MLLWSCGGVWKRACLYVSYVKRVQKKPLGKQNQRGQNRPKGGDWPGFWSSRPALSRGHAHHVPGRPEEHASLGSLRLSRRQHRTRPGGLRGWQPSISDLLPYVPLIRQMRLAILNIYHNSLGRYLLSIISQSTPYIYICPYIQYIS